MSQNYDTSLFTNLNQCDIISSSKRLEEIMKAWNITKTIMKFFGVCVKTVFMAAALPVFVVLSALKEQKPQPKHHILCTYRYVNN